MILRVGLRCIYQEIKVEIESSLLCELRKSRGMFPYLLVRNFHYFYHNRKTIRRGNYVETFFCSFNGALKDPRVVRQQIVSPLKERIALLQREIVVHERC